MIHLPRLLAAGAAALGASLLATACSAGPYAATVGGRTITQADLNAELSSLSANRSYIKAIDAANLQSGPRIEGPEGGTYNSAWTAHVLTGLVQAAAVAQHLAARGRVPSRYQVMVVRAVEAANYGQYWDRFSAAYRLDLSERAADLTLLPLPSVPEAELRSAYTRFAPYFFTEVCVRQASFPSRAAASAFTALPSTAGNVTCFTPAEFENQSEELTSTVLTLGVGQTGAPKRTANGYTVFQVTSRTRIPYGDAFRKALTVVLTANGPNPALDALLAGDHVRVDPMYGTWRGSARTGFRVVPPAPPSQG